MQSRNQEQRQAASTVLEKAVDAGVPYYAMGVRLLSEALGIVSEESERMGKAARLVQAVALRTVATEAFTTVRP
jgi:phosphosulfolactate synthase (CoM biosynthesis protein A)